MEWDIEGADGDPLEDFRITPAQGERQEAASWSCWHSEPEEYMESVRQGAHGGAYVEETQRSRVNIEEEMDVAAVGTHDGHRWEPASSSPPAFMVFKAAEAPVWEDLKVIWPPMYDGNPL